jgi:hypothetical protein
MKINALRPTSGILNPFVGIPIQRSWLDQPMPL